MVSIAAFQAVDPGSIPGRRNFFPVEQCPCSAILVQVSHRGHEDEVAEWLRRWTANPMGSARVGSNPILVGLFGQFYGNAQQLGLLCVCSYLGKLLILSRSLGMTGLRGAIG